MSAYCRDTFVKDRLLHKLRGSNFGVEAVEALAARNQYGRQVTESLIKYISKRIEIENEYAQALNKLSDHEFPELYPIMKKALKHHEGYTIEPGNDNDRCLLSTALKSIQRDLGSHVRSHRAFAASLEREVLAKFRRSLSDQVKTKLTHQPSLFESAETIGKMTRMLSKMQKNTVDLSYTLKDCERKIKTEQFSQTAVDQLERSKMALYLAQKDELDQRTALMLLRKKFTLMISQATIDIVDAEQTRIITSVKAMKAYARILDNQCDTVKNLTSLITKNYGDNCRFISDPGSLDKVSESLELLEFCTRYIYPTIKPVEDCFQQISFVEHAMEKNSDVSYMCTDVDLLYEAGF